MKKIKDFFYAVISATSLGFMLIAIVYAISAAAELIVNLKMSDAIYQNLVMALISEKIFKFLSEKAEIYYGVSEEKAPE